MEEIGKDQRQRDGENSPVDPDKAKPTFTEAVKPDDGDKNKEEQKDNNLEDLL